jgi:hypothetical protein
VTLSNQALLYPYHARSPWSLAAAGIASLLAGAAAHAQTDEIQVYDAEINDPGQFSLQLHSNYTPIGRKLPDFPGGIVPNRTLNGVPEWAYGVVDWLELGAYVGAAAAASTSNFRQIGMPTSMAITIG